MTDKRLVIDDLNLHKYEHLIAWGVLHITDPMADEYDTIELAVSAESESGYERLSIYYDGNKDINLIHSGSISGDVILGGSGKGYAIRKGIGGGLAILNGGREGEARFESTGIGTAINYSTAPGSVVYNGNNGCTPEVLYAKNKELFINGKKVEILGVSNCEYEYGLYFYTEEELYCAGCRSFTYPEAVEHWENTRPDFVRVIKKHREELMRQARSTENGWRNYNQNWRSMGR